MKPITRTPEPCLTERCFSPVACECHGYCRGRSINHLPTPAEAEEWKREAAKRRATFDAVEAA